MCVCVCVYVCVCVRVCVCGFTSIRAFEICLKLQSITHVKSNL